MTKTLEPTDKLDATTVVNGPEGEVLDWHAIDWRAVEDDVRRLRQRIFTASQAGDLAKVRNLQKLMLRSRANTLLSVRRVTERNQHCRPASLWSLLEPGAVKAARPVLRGPGRSNASRLPDHGETVVCV